MVQRILSTITLKGRLIHLYSNVFSYWIFYRADEFITDKIVRFQFICCY